MNLHALLAGDVAFPADRVGGAEGQVSHKLHVLPAAFTCKHAVDCTTSLMPELADCAVTSLDTVGVSFFCHS
eukprot:366366-Chlamydomonas_euryale.AAC.21